MNGNYTGESVIFAGQEGALEAFGGWFAQAFGH
jgi:hypothetical protein